MTWTKKNQQFARSCGFRPSSTELAQWILRRTDRYKATEKLIDLKEFNREIGKSRIKGEYDPKTVKEANAQLDEASNGWFQILKSHNWHLHTLLVRPVEAAIKKKSDVQELSPKLNRGNPMFSDAHKKRSEELLLQNISRLDAFLKQLGMNYDRGSLMRIWQFSGKKMSEVKNAVEYMLRVNSEKLEHSESLNGEAKGIRTAKGWLHDCLKCGWHIYDREVELPYINGNYIHSFVDSLMGKIPPCPT